MKRLMIMLLAITSLLTALNLQAATTELRPGIWYRSSSR